MLFAILDSKYVVQMRAVDPLATSASRFCEPQIIVITF